MKLETVHARRYRTLEWLGREALVRLDANNFSLIKRRLRAGQTVVVVPLAEEPLSDCGPLRYAALTIDELRQYPRLEELRCATLVKGLKLCIVMYTDRTVIMTAGNCASGAWDTEHSVP